MKNTQLRRGNKVLHNGIEKTIDCISPGYVIFFEDRKETDDFGQWVDLDEVKFIPINEKRLLELGFTKLDNTKNGIGTDNNEYWIEFVIDRIFFFIADIPPSVSVKHIHQVQNLYFALTNEEL